MSSESSMDLSEHYRGKRVVVTGCHSGIGHATAGLLVAAGAEVHGFDIKPVDPALAHFAALDLRDARSIEAAAASVGGPVDALFNCAGVSHALPPLEVMKVNFIGTRYLTELLVPAMARGAAVVSVASNGGAGWPQNLALLKQLTATTSFDAAAAWYEANSAAAKAAYSFSKEALIVWTMQASTTLITQGIRINCTNPGAVQTPMLEQIEAMTSAAVIDVVAQPIGRRSSAEEQACPLLFLNSAAASYVNGAVLPVDGGFLSARAMDDAASQTPVGRS
jgi:NAD(P)-dependent dehydrogenase (short-subunit alcohol dehydrogenase family)